MSEVVQWLVPDWSAASCVRVVSTLRSGGASEGPYASLNLAAHVGDDPDRVRENRRRLRTAASLPGEPLWLAQLHGCDVAVHDGRTDTPQADAVVARSRGHVCSVMTADCLPVVLADKDGTRIGIAHAGWRGMAGGVIEATIAALDCDASRLLAWLGPAIGQGAFEVGPEVRQAFVARSAESAAWFESNGRGRFQADLYGLARLVLHRAGVREVSGGVWCTATDGSRFFSHRRDGTTGRMATLAWLE